MYLREVLEVDMNVGVGTQQASFTYYVLISFLGTNGINKKHYLKVRRVLDNWQAI